MAVLLSLMVGTGLLAVENGLKPDEICASCVRGASGQNFDFQ